MTNPKDNPLVAITLWFQDGAAFRAELEQVFDSPVPQGKAMAGLGHIVAELEGELRIELEGTLHASLESSEIQYRGIIVTGATEEEKQVLLNIWNQHGRLAALVRGDTVSLTIAPTPSDEKEGKGG